MSSLGFVFRTHPHSTSKGREGLDAILAASAFCEDIRIFFIDDGEGNTAREVKVRQSALLKHHLGGFGSGTYVVWERRTGK